VGERLGREVRERRSTPERERGPQDLGCTPGITGGEELATLAEEALETAEVDLLALERDPVPVSMRLQSPVAERFAELRNVDVDAVESARRRLVLPEGVDEAVRRDDLAAVQEKDGEQRALLAASDLERLPTRECLEGTEDPEVQRVVGIRQVTPLSPALNRPASEIQALLKGTSPCSSLTLRHTRDHDIYSLPGRLSSTAAQEEK
jgi:hypothetical protein